MPPAQQPQTSVFRLKNGLTVLVHPDKRFPLAALRLYARVGSAVEEPAKAGISHVLEHMVFKGTKKRSSGRVASDIEAVGGYLNAATSFDYTVFITELPAEHIELGMDVLQDMAFGAVFRAKDLDLEQKVVLAELERNEDNPSTRLFNRLQESVWRDSGYARPIIGFRDTVANLTTKDLRRFRQHFYQPQSMLLVVCGKVSPTTVSRLANKYFSGLENSRVWQRPPLPAPVTCPPDHNPVLVEYGPWNKAYLGLAVNLPPSGSSDIPGCEVLAQLLGGDRTSLLFRKYKYKEQLVDSIHSSSVTLERRSMLLVQATLNPANLTQVWLSLTKDLAELNADQFTDQDIARAKLNLEDAMFRSKETLSGLASKLGYFQFFESSPEAEQSYLLDLARFHRESLKNLLAKYLRIDMAKAVLLLPETFRKQAGPDLAEDMAEELACQDKDSTAQSRHLHPRKTAPVITPITESLTLALLPDPSLPYTAMDLTFAGGDSLCAESEQGLAQLSSRILTKGAGKRSTTELQDFLADRASAVHAHATRDQFSVSARFPSRFSSDILPLLQEIVLAPSFSDEETQREIQSQIAGIKSTEDRPLGLAFRRLFPSIFQDHPYGYLHMGTKSGLAAFTSDTARDFWHTQRQSTAVLAVCGDFNTQDMHDLATTLAHSGLAQYPPAMPQSPPSWTTTPSTQLTLADRNQAHVLLTFPTEPLDHAATSGLKLLRAILGGQGGILFPKLRDEMGLGYQVSAYNWQAGQAGFLTLYIGTQPSRVDEAINGFTSSLRELAAKPLPQHALDRGASLLLGNHFREHQTLASRSHETAKHLNMGLPHTFSRTQLRRAKDITPKQLQSLIKTYLDPASMFQLTVVP